MGMFGDLDKLGKQQQAAAIPRQQGTPSVPTHPTPTPLPSPASPTDTPLPVPRAPKKGREAPTRTPHPRDTQPPSERTAPRTKHAIRPNVRTNDRTKIRHSFDIFQDQLFALRELAYERERGLVTKVPLGDLVQEALDQYLAAHAHPTS